MLSTDKITDNLFLKYIRDIVPDELGANNPKAVGKLAEMVFLSEIAGEKAFSADNFDNVRERAAMCIPFQVGRGYQGKREHILDIIELCFHKHNIEHHGINNPIRIEQLSNTPMTEIEQELVDSTMGFWNI